jgi:succinylglutamate desuccinylase
MSVKQTRAYPELSEYPILSHEKADDEAPLILIFGGMHGNEGYGVAAIRKLHEILRKSGGIERGEFIGMAANSEALRKGVRYVDEDMNRIWFPSILDKIRRTPMDRIFSNERRQIKELLDITDPMTRHSGREVVVVDLHSFSAPGGLFLITPRKRFDERLNGLRTPIIFGVDDALQGAALRYYHSLGHTALAFEGGSHHETRTLANMVSFLLLLFEKFGLIQESSVHGFSDYKSRFEQQTEGLPQRVELAYQHMIEPDDRFVMRPGYQNFQMVQKGEWLADDRNGRIYSPLDGYMLMPLYQDQGDDGFFIVQDTEQ